VSSRDLRLQQQAAELRHAFDRSFAEAPRAGIEQFESLLSVRVGPDAYAIRLTEVSGLFAGRKITRLPDAAPGCLGIAGFRGSVVPVFDLRVLLGYPTADVPRWLVAAAGAPVALAFDAFDGHLRFPREAIARADAGGVRPHVREILRTAHAVLPIVHVTSILEAITQSARPEIAQKE
jgi:chemotaxis signal transduction protein